MRPEAENYRTQLETLIAFAEGRLDGPALNAALATEEMKALLGVFDDPHNPAITKYYHRLQDKQDRSTLSGLTNSEGIIEDFLRKAEVVFRPAKRFSGLYSLILKSVPDYVDPPLEFLMEKVVLAISDQSDSQKKKIIKERLHGLFKYVDKPPKWIQNPDWPIRDRNPLVFVGQLPINAPAFFHDNGAAYLFFSPADGTFETVTQFH